MAEQIHFTPINRARHEITEILKRLEVEVGREVTGLDIQRIECTSCSDARKQYLKCVAIDLAPDSVSKWE